MAGDEDRGSAEIEAPRFQRPHRRERDAVPCALASGRAEHRRRPVPGHALEHRPSTALARVLVRGCDVLHRTVQTHDEAEILGEGRTAPAEEVHSYQAGLVLKHSDVARRYEDISVIPTDDQPTLNHGIGIEREVAHTLRDSIAVAIDFGVRSIWLGRRSGIGCHRRMNHAHIPVRDGLKHETVLARQTIL